MRTVAVVLAGGSGVRLGGGTPKQLQLLAGRTLLEHCVAAFDAAPGVDEVVVVMPANLVGEAERILAGRYGKLSHVIAGGADRPGSTGQDRKSTRLNSSHMSISYAVFCLKKKKN